MIDIQEWEREIEAWELKQIHMAMHLRIVLDEYFERQKQHAEKMIKFHRQLRKDYEDANNAT